MTGPRYSDLVAAPGVRARSTPWRVADNGTVMAADGEVVCVLGHPEQDLTEEDVVQGALILQAPQLLGLAQEVETLLTSTEYLAASHARRNALAIKLRQVIAKAEGRP